MSVVFESDFFSANRERLRQLFTGTAPIVLTANGLLQKNGDEGFPFNQDANFWYLTGIEDPDVILVMDKAKEYLIIPARDPIIEFFEGAIDTATIARRSGIKDVLPEKEGWKQLESRLKRVRHVATLAAGSSYIERYGMYANPARHRLIKRLKDSNPGIDLLDLTQHLSRMRMVKYDIEVAAIQEAIDITADTLKDLTRPAKLAKYAYEYEIEADLSRGFRRRGVTAHAFTPVVAGGKNACTLHHTGSDALASDDLLVLDVGATSNHYAADITRTVSLNGKPSRRQQQVYDAVLAAQEYAFSLLKPGLVFKEYEQLIENFIGEKLRELGLIKSISHEVIRGEGFYPHRASHFLGLEAHDVGMYDEPLKAGSVLAVEPGMYIRSEGIGVRIEDNVLITADGCMILSTKLPRSL